MITKTRTAYKIGFSSALNRGSISVYAEMAKWTFQEDNHKKLLKLRLAFCKGYRHALNVSAGIYRDGIPKLFKDERGPVRFSYYPDPNNWGWVKDEYEGWSIQKMF